LFVFIVGQPNTFRLLVEIESLERSIVLEDGKERDILLGFDRLDSSWEGKTLKLRLLLQHGRNVNTKGGKTGFITTTLHVDHQTFESLNGAEKGKYPAP
jgi:hypothetical protein